MDVKFSKDGKQAVITVDLIDGEVSSTGKTLLRVKEAPGKVACPKTGKVISFGVTAYEKNPDFKK